MVNTRGLSNKVAVVTGASKGIGGGIATALGSAGARVAVNYSSDREGAERVAQAITDNGGEAIAVGADVSKAADVVRLFKEVDSAFGRLDVLVNNAGVFRFGAIAPGHTETEGNVAAGTFEGGAGAVLAGKTPLGRLGRITDIAPLAVFLASDESAWITGEVIRAAGGLVVAT